MQYTQRLYITGINLPKITVLALRQNRKYNTVYKRANAAQ